ncbi:toll/interleukin-1 receptor domain-containing protein [Tellurirhabdus rosea]|uniref:toll/interleukin-1 receptor domain-containing protein n=1 Tax=Tellurirhabdus rosea TaxID=2674997 RepID=UPI00225144E3|nr:TIR domain-containing protein [Tellurirhabdus rosea]
MNQEKIKALHLLAEKLRLTRDFLNHDFLDYISKSPVMEPMKWNWAIDTYKFILAEKHSIPEEIYSLCNALFIDVFQTEGQKFVELCSQRIEIVQKGKPDNEIREVIINQYHNWRKEFTIKANETIASVEQSLTIPEGLEKSDYDIGLSFAGENRSFVENVALILRENGVKVFYDSFEADSLWGKNLYQHLNEIYKTKCKFTIIFISEAYSRKHWTNHELKSAQARVFKENREYILPVRFDDTQLPELDKTVGYLDARSHQPSDIAELALRKLKSINSR